MDGLIAARAQMGMSLGFHIIFSTLGVGLPLFLFIAEGWGLRTGDKVWYAMARRWSKAFAILFAIGAVSGTILSFEMGLLWPRFMAFSTAVIGLPFALEGFAFFIEAIFLALYLYGWERLSPRTHWLCSVPLVISGVASAWFIVTVNAWMNTPAGFRLQDGRLVDINPIAAMLNPGTPNQTVHMILAAFEATGFAVAAVYAVAWLRGRRDTLTRRALLLGLAVGCIVAPIQVYSGSANAKLVAQYQPAKLAAMEAQFQTQANAPLHIFGWPDVQAGKLQYDIQIPSLLSFLAYDNPNAVVKGLDAFPASERPDPRIVHTSYNIMVAIGFLMAGLAVAFWGLFFLRRRTIPDGRLGTLVLWGVVAAGPLTFLAIEMGWITTEIGRQPWIIQGIMKVKDAVSPAPGLGLSFFTFTAIYIVLAVATTVLLLRLARESSHEAVEEAAPEQAPSRETSATV